jgi:nicotinamidase-related amidase
VRTKTALVIIDMQSGLVAGLKPVYQLHALLGHITTLIAHARAAEIPIIYFQDNDVDKIGSPGWQIHPTIPPHQHDLVLRKPEADAFYRTELRQKLEACNIERLIIAGCKSEVCIDTTCRKAVQLGYQVTLVSDAHSTTDNPVLRAPQIIAYHNYLLPMVWSDEDGKVVEITVKSTGEVVTESI